MLERSNNRLNFDSTRMDLEQIRVGQTSIPLTISTPVPDYRMHQRGKILVFARLDQSELPTSVVFEKGNKSKKNGQFYLRGKLTVFA